MENKLKVRDEFIDQLLLENNISLRRIYKFANEHIEELKQVKHIFDLKQEKDKKLCLALFRLMTGKNAEAITKCFCEKHHITDSLLDDIFFEENKLFLITAFIYNPSFFSMSWNLCGIIMSHLAYLEEIRESKTITDKIIPFIFKRTITAYAASGDGYEMKELWSEDIIQDEIIHGKLRIFANNKENTGMVQFRFKFSNYYPEPPCSLRIHYITNSDNIEHTAELSNIVVNNSRIRELVIASAPQQGICYEEGITTKSLEGIIKNG